MISKLKDAASSSTLQLKILHDTDKRPTMTLIHQSVSITEGSAIISMPQDDESLRALRGKKKGRAQSRLKSQKLVLLWYLSGHQSRARAIQRSQIRRLRQPQSFFKYDCKLVYLTRIQTHWCNHMLIKGAIKSPVHDSGMVPPVDTSSLHRWLYCRSDLFNRKRFDTSLLRFDYYAQSHRHKFPADYIYTVLNTIMITENILQHNKE